MSARRLCRADEVAEGHGKGFVFGAGMERFAVFLVRHKGALHAYVNSCPHYGAPLDFPPDRFFDQDGEHLLCSLHGALFRPDDGQCVDGPCYGRSLAPASIAIEEGEVFLEEGTK